MKLKHNHPRTAVAPAKEKAASAHRSTSGRRFRLIAPLIAVGCLAAAVVQTTRINARYSEQTPAPQTEVVANEEHVEDNVLEINTNPIIINDGQRVIIDDMYVRLFETGGEVRGYLEQIYRKKAPLNAAPFRAVIGYFKIDALKPLAYLGAENFEKLVRHANNHPTFFARLPGAIMDRMFGEFIGLGAGGVYITGTNLIVLRDNEDWLITAGHELIHYAHWVLSKDRMRYRLTETEDRLLNRVELMPLRLVEGLATLIDSEIAQLEGNECNLPTPYAADTAALSVMAHLAGKRQIIDVFCSGDWRTVQEAVDIAAGKGAFERFVELMKEPRTPTDSQAMCKPFNFLAGMLKQRQGELIKHLEQNDQIIKTAFQVTTCMRK